MLCTREGLTNAVLSSPEDLAPKFILADYLDDIGDPVGPCLRDVIRCVPEDFSERRNPLADYDAITLMDACRLVFPPVDDISKLSDKQSAMLPAFRDAWIKVGLGTGGYDLDTVKQTIEEAYNLAGLRAPATFIELPSPLHGGAKAMGKWILMHESAKDDVVGSAWDPVIKTVWNRLYYPVQRAVYDLVFNSVINSALDAKVGFSRISSIHAAYGLHDAHWLSTCATYYAFGVRRAKKAAPLARLATQIGWWWPYEDVVIVTPRPQSITMDERGKPVELSWQGFTVKLKTERET